MGKLKFAKYGAFRGSTTFSASENTSASSRRGCRLSGNHLFVLLASGGTALGLLSDWMGKRAPVVTCSLVLAMGALVGYSREYRGGFYTASQSRDLLCRLFDIAITIFCYTVNVCSPPSPDSPNDQVINAVLLATTGFFIGGPSSMISSAISADLGRQEALRGSQEALATVTGIVDGTGSIGAAGGQVKPSFVLPFQKCFKKHDSMKKIN